MRYNNTNHKRVNTLTDEELCKYYYCSLSTPMNIMFNGKIHRQFTDIYNYLLSIYDHPREVKVFLYHAALTYSRETRGFIVSLRKQTYEDLRINNPKEDICTYYKFTNMLETFVHNGIGELFIGEDRSSGENLKSVFVLSTEFKSLFDKKDKRCFPSCISSILYNDLIVINTEKDKNNKTVRITTTIRGVRPLKNNVKLINEYLAQFEFRDRYGNRFYPEMHRVFELYLDRYGRWFFPSQNMKSRHRQFITIDGETVSEYDLVSNHAFLCCQLAGQTVSANFKPYSIEEEGLVTKVPEGCDEREVYKLGMMCLLNCKGNYSSALKNSWDKELKGFEGKENSAQIIKGLQKRNHFYLDEIKRQNAGTLQNLDSRIMEHCMLYLMKHNVPFLPWHDSIVVPSSCTIAEDALRYGWSEVMGSDECCFVEKKY